MEQKASSNALPAIIHSNTTGSCHRASVTTSIAARAALAVATYQAAVQVLLCCAWTWGEESAALLKVETATQLQSSPSGMFALMFFPRTMMNW